MKTKSCIHTTLTRATIFPRPVTMACIVFGAFVPCALGQTIYGFDPGIDSVTVSIPRALALPGSKLFARLGVEIP